MEAVTEVENTHSEDEAELDAQDAFSYRSGTMGVVFWSNNITDLLTPTLELAKSMHEPQV